MTASRIGRAPPGTRRLADGATGLILASLAVALATASLGGWWLHDRGSDGPTVYYPDVDYGLHPLDPSATSFTLGSIYITEPGKDPQVVSVRPICSDNLDYLGGFVVWPSDQHDSRLGVGPGFPSPSQPHRHPLDQLIPAAETSYSGADSGGKPWPLTVSVGFKFGSGDRALVDAVQVTYRVGGEIRHMLVKHAVIACVAPRNCAQPDNESDKQYWAELTGSLHFVQAR
jgi:hypothetical protein